MYIIIIGCGRVGSELAGLLSSEKHNVVVIDKDPNGFDRLGDSFNGLTIVGNGFMLDVLKNAGIEKADAFCAVTHDDNTNIMASQIAKKIFKIPRVIARLYDPRRASIYKGFGLDIISGTELFAAMLRDKLMEKRLSSYLIESAELATVEIEVSDSLNGRSVESINIPGEFMVVALIRGNDTVMPSPEMTVGAGDKVLGVLKMKSINKIKKLFA
ncbi:potassium channel family protein [Candidatus Omnitrophota bacterium]